MNFWNVVDAAASRFPERTAIEVQRRDSLDGYTYRELCTLAQRCAAWLAGHGIQQGDRCAILADNDVWWCSAALGILRVGAVAVPLDTSYSAPQIAAILHATDAQVLFVNERLASLASQATVGLNVLVAPVARPSPAAPLTPAAPAAPFAPVHRTAPDAPIAPVPPFAPDAAVAPDAPALILHTSGTTADAKSVVLTHGNLIAARDAATRVIAVSEHDNVLGVLPLFDAHGQLINLLLPLAAGARVVFLESASFDELLGILTERQITILAGLPQFFEVIHPRLLAEVESDGIIRRRLFFALLNLSFALRRTLGINIGPALFAPVHTRVGKQLRLLLAAGSRFDPAIGRDLYALGFTILKTYGLTETSGVATITQPDDAFVDTVGRPLPGQQVKILPPSDEGADGEIAIRGAIVMHGYFNCPDATRDVLEDGWLRTGDLGRFDRSGRLTITGRRKEVIVLPNGQHIYPEVVEAQYRKSQFIKELCVLRPIGQADPQEDGLSAVVVPDQELLRRRRIANAGDLLRFEMEGQSIDLPPYQRVRQFQVWFEALPRTPTGMLKRHEIERRLRAAAASDAPTCVEPEANWVTDPQISAAVAIISARAPGRVVRAGANLELDLGLDSMERVALLSELEGCFGVRVDHDRVHEILTVQQLLEALRASEAGETLRRAESSWSVLLDEAVVAHHPVVRGLFDRRPIAVPIFFALSRLLRLALGPRTVYGREHLPLGGPYIITPNHQGYLDPFILCAALPFRVFRELFFVGASEYFETRFTKWLAKKINLLPVDPDANLVPAMQASAFGLKHGKILVLFPEGERSIDGTVKRFKKGAPILAQHLAVPVVPVAIRGSFELWPRNRAINWRALLPSGHRVRVAFGPPIRFAPTSGYSESASQLRDAVVKMWDVI